MKKALSILLTLAIIGSIITMPAMASTTASALPEDYVEAYEYFYSEFDGTAVPSGYTADTWVTPKEIEGDSVLEFGYENATSTVGKFYTPTITNRNASGTNALENLNDLVFEYRFRYNPENTESQSYFSFVAEGDPYAAAVFMAAPSYNLTNSIAWHMQHSTPVASFDSMAEWHTITIVYPADGTNVRRLYVDGVYYGESTDAKVKVNKVEVDNIWANPWGRTGKARWYLRSYSAAKVSEYYLDYVKAYEKSSHFIAEIENAASTERESVVVSFNNTFGAATAVPSAFSVTDGTKTVTASSVNRIDAKKIEILFSEPLDKNTAYTLNVKDVKDNTGTALYNTAMTFTTNNSEVFSEETVYYYNGFEGSDPALSYYLTAAEVDYGNTVTDDGESVFRVQGLDVHQNTGNPDFRTPSVSFSEANAPDELMLEYRFKLNVPNEDAYLGVWKNDVRSAAAAFGRYADKKDKVFFHYTDKTPIDEEFSVDTSEWTTVTIAYPKDVQKRKVYVNGTYLGESAEGKQENTFASAGETAFTFLTDFKSPDDILEVDYVKYYQKAFNFDVKLSDVKASAVTVEFNSTPANMTAENISFSDGTAIADIRRVNEKNFVIIPAEKLSGEISLDLSKIKDSIGRSIEESSLSLELREEQETEEKVYLFKDFESSDEIGLLTTSNGVTPTVETSDDGLSVLRFENTGGTDSNASGAYYFDDDMTVATSKNSSVAIENSPVLVFEYKVRMSSTCNGYDYFTTRVASELSAVLGGYSYKNKVRATATTSRVFAEVTQSDWVKITTVYSNTDGSRKVYVNDEFAAEVKEGDEDYTASLYSQSGYKTFKPHFIAYMKNLGDYCELDYFKLYSLPDYAEVEKVSVSDDMKSVSLDFNTVLGTLDAEMIKVGGVCPSDVSLTDSENYVYTATFDKALLPGKTYDLFISGAETFDGKALYESSKIVTRAAEEITVSVSCDNSEAGVISVNGTDSTTVTVTEGSDVSVNVKAKINYTATVTQDGKALEPDKAGNYIARSVTSETDLQVIFAETVFNATLAKNKIPTTGQTYSHGTATWAFASLRKEANEYGFVVAKTRKELESASAVETALTGGTAIKIQASKVNSLGEYGILIMDKNNKFAGQYYVVPYATYDIGTIYGTPVFAGHKR